MSAMLARGWLRGRRGARSPACGQRRDAAAHRRTLRLRDRMVLGTSDGCPQVISGQGLAILRAWASKAPRWRAGSRSSYTKKSGDAHRTEESRDVLGRSRPGRKSQACPRLLPAGPRCRRPKVRRRCHYCRWPNEAMRRSLALSLGQRIAQSGLDMTLCRAVVVREHHHQHTRAPQVRGRLWLTSSRSEGDSGSGSTDPGLGSVEDSTAMLRTLARMDSRWQHRHAVDRKDRFDRFRESAGQRRARGRWDS